MKAINYFFNFIASLVFSIKVYSSDKVITFC